MLKNIDNGIWLVTNQSDLLIHEKDIYVEISLLEVRDYVRKLTTDNVDFFDSKLKLVSEFVPFHARYTYSIGTFIKDYKTVKNIDQYKPKSRLLTIEDYSHNKIKITTLGEISKKLEGHIFPKNTHNCIVGLVDAFLENKNYGPPNKVQLILNGINIFNCFFNGSKNFTQSCLNQSYPGYWNNEFCNPYLSFCTIDYNESNNKSVYVRLKKRMDDIDAKPISLIMHDEIIGNYLERINKHISGKKGRFSIHPYYLDTSEKKNLTITANTKGKHFGCIESANSFYLPSRFDITNYTPSFDEVIFSRDNDGRTGEIKKGSVKRKRKKLVPIPDNLEGSSKPKSNNKNKPRDSDNDFDIHELTNDEYSRFLPQVENLIGDQFTVIDSIRAKKEEKKSSTHYETEIQLVPVPAKEGRKLSFSAWSGGLNKGNVASIENAFRSNFNFNDFAKELEKIRQINNGHIRYYDLKTSMFKNTFLKSRVIIPEGKSIDSIPDDYFLTKSHKQHKQGRQVIIVELTLHKEKIFLLDFEPKHKINTVISLLKLNSTDERETKSILKLLFQNLTRHRPVAREMNTFFESFPNIIENFKFMLHKSEDNHNYFLGKIDKLIDKEEFTRALVYKKNDNEEA